MWRLAFLVVATATVAVAAATANDEPTQLDAGRGFDLTVRLSDVRLTVLNTTASAASAAEAKILIEEGCLPAGGPAVRRLLTFSTTIRNDGDEDLFIGQPPHNRSLKTANWEVRRGGGWVALLGKGRWARGAGSGGGLGEGVRTVGGGRGHHGMSVYGRSC